MRLIQSYKIHGQLQAMSSKSYLQRALAIAALAKSKSELTNVRWSSDSEAAHKIIQQLGAKTRMYDERIVIQPRKPLAKDETEWNAGESGLSLRMFSCIAALFDHEISIDGSGSLKERPLVPIIEALRRAGANAQSRDGKMPIIVKGPYPGGKIKVDGTFSSQIITGLLIALPLAKSDSTLEVNNLQSTPYVDMTLDIMQEFGVSIIHEDYETFYIGGRQEYEGITYSIEGDWSAAANFLVGAAISGEIEITGLKCESRQADAAIVEVLKNCGALVHCEEDKISVTRNDLYPFQFDATHCPDLFPPLIVLAAACSGTSRITGTNRLLHKESNRLSTLIDTFHRLGVNLGCQGDELLVHGTGRIKGNKVHAHGDHRIAMAAAISGSLADGPIEIDEPEVVNKSYPQFFEDLDSCIINKT